MKERKPPIEINDISEARANVSYIIKPVKKEKRHGEAVPPPRSTSSDQG